MQGLYRSIFISFSSDINVLHHSIFVCNYLTPDLYFYFQPLTHVCAKNLATFVSQEAGNRPVLLGLALKDSSIDAIKQMKEIIKSCQVW